MPQHPEISSPLDHKSGDQIHSHDNDIHDEDVDEDIPIGESKPLRHDVGIIAHHIHTRAAEISDGPQKKAAQQLETQVRPQTVAVHPKLFLSLALFIDCQFGHHMNLRYIYHIFVLSDRCRPLSGGVRLPHGATGEKIKAHAVKNLFFINYT